MNRSKAIEAGATKVGGSDLIKLALKGNVHFSDYQFILAHPDIMPEMLALRGLMKKRFPTAKNETLGLDMHAMVSKFINGIANFIIKSYNFTIKSRKIYREEKFLKCNHKIWLKIEVGSNHFFQILFI